MRNRGQVHTPELATQMRDFSGLKYGKNLKITPTDIDCHMDFGRKFFVVAEAKLPGIEMPDGQRWAIEAEVDDHKSPTIGILCEHPNRVGVIDFAACIVLQYRWREHWLIPKTRMTVRQVIDAMLKLHRLEYYIGKTGS